MFQEYLQANEDLKLDVFIIPPAGLQIGENKLLRIRNPLFGLNDAGYYWHETFKKNLNNDLAIRPTTGDLSFYGRKHNRAVAGVIAPYVDDTLSTGTLAFKQKVCCPKEILHLAPQTQLVHLRRHLC